jgi:hypothetical protein
VFQALLDTACGPLRRSVSVSTYGRIGVITTDGCAGEKVINKGAFAERIQRDVPLGITRKNQGTPSVKQRLIAKFVC